MEKPAETTNKTDENVVKTVRPKPGEVKVTVPVDQPMVRAEEKPKRGNPWALAVVLLTLIIIGLAVALVYVLLFMPSGEDGGEDVAGGNADIIVDMDEVVLTEADKEILAEAKDDAEVRAVMKTLYGVVEKLATVPVEGNGKYVATITKSYDTIFPERYLENKETLAPLSRSYGISVQESSEINKQIYDRIVNGEFTSEVTRVLTDVGFVEYAVLKDAVSRGNKEYYNEKTGVICEVDRASNPFVVACAHKSWYDKDTEELENGLAQAYYEKEGKNPEYIYAEPSGIVNSSVEPYQRILGIFADTKGMFYRVSPEAKWQYFTNASGTLLCDRYDTDDLKKAFAGEQCYTDSTVGEAQAVQP